MTRKIGKFWKYTGNANGKNHERKTPKGYDLETVARVAAAADEVEGYGHEFFSKSITRDEATQMEIIHHRGDSFGHEITVKAPKSVWDKLKAWRQ